MSACSESQVAALRELGSVVRETLDTMLSAVRPGMTTAELDGIGAGVLSRHGAQSAPQLVYGFPGCNLISVDDEIVHGVPGSRILVGGDLVTVDVTAEREGLIADAAVSQVLQPIDSRKHRLCECAREALADALKVARAGEPIHVIGRAVESCVKRSGYSVIPDLGGHGVGPGIHEDPVVRNYYDERDTTPLRSGQVITIEPIVLESPDYWVEDEDGWTVRSAAGTLSAHFEHTVVITDGAPLILTA